MTVPSNESLNAYSSLTELSGTILEQRYRLGRILGAGGMGAVFEATHLRLERRVAIKLLRPGLATHDGYISRFLREAKAATKIRHRNVVEILDYGEAAGGLIYSVMEFLQGRDLLDLLRSLPDERLPWPRTCDLLIQVASGLKAAHCCGVIHRDIKPANCFLTEEDGEPIIKLVDFGIARLDDADQQDHQLTGTTDLLGTPNYIAPELVRTRESASPQSDIYSLGVLAYRMLTGRVPFFGDTTFELLRRVCFEPVPPMRTFVPEIPPEVEALIFTLLAKRPEHRPADMAEVRDRLAALRHLGSKGVTSTGTPVVHYPAPGGEWTPSGTSTPAPDAGPSMAYAATVVAPAPTGPPAARAKATVLAPPPTQDDIPTHSSGMHRSTSGLGTPSGGAPQIVASPTEPTESALGDATQMLEYAELFVPARPSRSKWLLLLPAGIGLFAAITGLAMLLSGGDDPPSTSEAEVASVTRSVLDEASKPADDEPTAISRPPQPIIAAPPPSPDPPPPPAEPMTLHIDFDQEEPIDDAPAETTSPPTKQSRNRHRKHSRPSGGRPTDNAQLKALKRKIASKCTPAQGDSASTLSFVVNSSGQAIGLTSRPNNTRGQCAIKIASNTKFRARDTSTPFKLTVK